MKHMRPLNKKAGRIDDFIVARTEHASRTEDVSPTEDVVAMQDRPSNTPQRPHVPMGCALMFTPGWEVDAAGGTAGLCQPVERDIYDCFVSCYWPAQVPDHLNNAPDWTAKCASATKDWRNLDLVFP
jgi:hypothetical protein